MGVGRKSLRDAASVQWQLCCNPMDVSSPGLLGPLRQPADTSWAHGLGCSYMYRLCRWFSLVAIPKIMVLKEFSFQNAFAPSKSIFFLLDISLPSVFAGIEKKKENS